MNSKVLLLGGLGNQLFGWAFSEYLKRRLGRPSELLTMTRRSSSYQHGSHLEQLDLADVLFNHRRAMNSLRLALASRVFGPTNEKAWSRSRAMGVTSFQEIGYPEGYQFEEDELGHLYLGYFQTYRFAAEAVPRGNELRALFSLDSSTSPTSVAVHIRQGDYLMHSKSLGVLGLDYYTDAIRKQLSLAETRSLNFFGTRDSGSVELVSRICKEFPGLESSFISLEQPLEPAADLRRLATFNRQVMSNSSYSWWAAYLAEDGDIVSPTKWFRGTSDPKELKPSRWMTVESSWQQLEQ